MGVAVMLLKFKDGEEQDFSKDEIENILASFMTDKDRTKYPSGIAFLQHQPWFESCDIIPNGNAVDGILFSKPHTEEKDLAEVIFRLLEIEHTILMSEHFDLFQCRMDMLPHLPAEIEEIISDMSEEDGRPMNIITSSKDVWPEHYKSDFFDEDDDEAY